MDVIPVFILKDEINKNLSKDQMIQLYLDLERSSFKIEMFELLRKAVDELRPGYGH